MKILSVLLAAFLFAASPLLASPQYSGSAFTATVSQDGTQQTLINNIETALLNGGSGWTTVSGHGTTNLLMQSGTTPAGLQINARFKTNTGGSNIQIYLENTAGTLKPSSYSTSNGCTLQVVNGVSYTVVASKFQFIITDPVNYLTSRRFCWVGMPYLTSDLALTITTAGFLFSDSQSDSDTSERMNIRCDPQPVAGDNSCNNSGQGNHEMMLNSYWWETHNAANSSNYGEPRFFWLSSMSANGTQISVGFSAYRWYTSTPALITSDILISWGPSSGGSTEAFIVGQIYDALFIYTSQSTGSTGTWSGHNWFNMTGTNGSAPPGTWWFATS